MSRYKGYSNSELAGMTLYEKVMAHCREDGGHLLWEGSFDVQNYPYFSYLDQGVKRRVLVRRYLFLLENPGLVNPIVSNDPDLCGVGECVLPAHQLDRRRFPRSKVGVRRTRAVRSMRVTLVQELGRSGYKPEEIAHGLSLNLATVSRILNKEK